MITGRIQRLYVDKGFAFLRDPQTGIEYFCHKSALQNARFEDLQEMQAVQFEAGAGPKGPRAESVRLL